MHSRPKLQVRRRDVGDCPLLLTGRPTISIRGQIKCFLPLALLLCWLPGIAIRADLTRGLISGFLRSLEVNRKSWRMITSQRHRGMTQAEQQLLEKVTECTAFTVYQLQSRDDAALGKCGIRHTTCVFLHTQLYRGILKTPNEKPLLKKSWSLQNCYYISCNLKPCFSVNDLKVWRHH